MNTDTNLIEQFEAGPAPARYQDIFLLPEIGKRVASFAGYHWKVKRVDLETQEVVLEQDGLTTMGERAKSSSK